VFFHLISLFIPQFVPYHLTTFTSEIKKMDILAFIWTNMR